MIHLSMKRSRRELPIDMVVDKGIAKNNQIMLFPYFTFIPEIGTVWNCLKQGLVSV